MNETIIAPGRHARHSRGRPARAHDRLRCRTARAQGALSSTIRRRAPAFALADATTCAPFTDEAALRSFAESVDVATYEFENVPREAAALVAGLVPLRPGVGALATSQDRLAEKRFIADLGIATAPVPPGG